MVRKHADGMTNSVDGDQTTFLGSAMFAESSLSQNVELFAFDHMVIEMHGKFLNCQTL